jgi:hypothetical protein
MDGLPSSRQADRLEGDVPFIVLNIGISDARCSGNKNENILYFRQRLFSFSLPFSLLYRRINLFVAT